MSIQNSSFGNSHNHIKRPAKKNNKSYNNPRVRQTGKGNNIAIIKDPSSQPIGEYATQFTTGKSNVAVYYQHIIQTNNSATGLNYADNSRATTDTTITQTGNHNVAYGSSGNDTYTLFNNDSTPSSNAVANSFFNGGEGIDTAQLYGKQSDWLPYNSSEGYGPSPVNALRNVNTGQRVVLQGVENITYAEPPAPGTT